MMMAGAVIAAAKEGRVLEVWLPLFAIVLAASWWYRVLRLRERVTAHARQLCERHGVQLLDDSVALHRLKVSWRHHALYVVREYRFETSTGGNDRRSASLTLINDRIAASSMPEPQPVAPTLTASFQVPYGRAPTPVTPGTSTGSNVIPINRARQTPH